MVRDLKTSWRVTKTCTEITNFVNKNDWIVLYHGQRLDRLNESNFHLKTVKDSSGYGIIDLLVGKENTAMTNSRAMNELQSYISRGRKEERESIAEALLAEARELSLRAEKAGAYRKYEDAGRFIEQARLLREVVLSIRKLPKNW